MSSEERGKEDESFSLCKRLPVALLRLQTFFPVKKKLSILSSKGKAKGNESSSLFKKFACSSAKTPDLFLSKEAFTSFQ